MKKRMYTMSPAALAARHKGGAALAARQPRQPRQWATVVLPAATKVVAQYMRVEGEPLWRPIDRAIRAAAAQKLEKADHPR
jgi:hypothetical protein